MKIDRRFTVSSIDIAISFELTGPELYDAYIEQQKIMDQDTVLNYLDDKDDDEVKEACYGTCRADAEAKVGIIASNMRFRIDKWNLDWETALEQALESVFFNGNGWPR